VSLRAVFLLLLFANLAFLAWANLIDVPAEPPRNDSISHLPQLELLSEARAKAQAKPSAAPSTSTSASESAGPGAATGIAAPHDGSGANGNAPAVPKPTTAPAARVGSPSPAHPVGAAPSASIAAATGPANVSHRCITVGPFGDDTRATAAADLLRDRGFNPRPRTEANQPQGYWVFIGGLSSASDEVGVVQRLERDGISDAKAMPAADGARRVSVGLFTARDGAERRARAVRRLGFDARIEPRQSGSAQWIDVSLDSSAQSIPAEGLLSLEEGGSRLEIKECPRAPAGTDGAQSSAAPKAPSGASRSTGRTPAPAPSAKPGVPHSLTAEGAPRPG
jgi:hypothetical protein